MSTRPPVQAACCDAPAPAPATGAARPRAPACIHLPQYLYEYRKGVRQLFMLTLRTADADAVQQRLAQEAIAWHAQAVGRPRVNLFFGRAVCVDVVRRIVTRPLPQLSAEEDFILGTLLGYEREQQCLRFLQRAGRLAG